MPQSNPRLLSQPRAKPSHEISIKEIFSLTWPQTLMMLFQFCIGITDVTVAGYIQPEVQAAFGYITQSLFFLLVIGIALANGGVAAMSQALGASLPLRATRYVGLLLKIGGAFSIIAVLTAYFFTDQLMFILQVPESVRDLTVSLWRVFLFIIPGQFFTSMCMAIFRSRKQVMIPLLVSIVACVINVIGDLALGLGMWGAPRLGGMGIVIASLVAVYAGVLVNLYMLVHRKILSKKSFSIWRWEKRALPYILKVALPSGGLQVLWQLGYIILFTITSTLPDQSVAAVAGLTVGLRIEGILFMPSMAFGATASILVGHCLGAGDKKEAKRVALRVIRVGVLGMAAVGFILYQFVPQISSFVAPDSNVQAIAARYLHYNILAVPFTCISTIVSGVMTGAGANIYTLVIYSTATWLVRLPIAWYMGHYVWQSADGVFFAMLISQIFQASAAVYVLTRCNWYRFASTAKRFTRGQ